MTSVETDLIENFLAEVTRQAIRLPDTARSDLIAELRSHLAEAAPNGEAEVRNAIAALGSPSDIATAALDEAGVNAESEGTVGAAAPLFAPPGPASSTMSGTAPLIVGVVSIVGLLIPPIAFVLGIIAIITGVVALRERRRAGLSAGRAAGAIACGGISVALSVLIVGAWFTVRTTTHEVYESPATEVHIGPAEETDPGD